MTDQLLYRLNRVPDRNYIKFLELIGVRLFPPTAATTEVTFWLSAPQEIPIVVPVGVEVATPRTETVGSGDRLHDHRHSGHRPLRDGLHRLDPDGRDVAQPHRRHQAVLVLLLLPAAGARTRSLLIGLSAAVPRCAVSLRFDCNIEGIGVDPDWPPLAWEAYDGDCWVECEVDRDTTGGLNRAGEVVLHVPPTHVMSLEHQLRAGWLRARVTTPEEDQPFYSNSPLIKGLEAIHRRRDHRGGPGRGRSRRRSSGCPKGCPGSASRWPGRRSSPRASPSSWRSPTTRKGWQEWTEVAGLLPEPARRPSLRARPGRR